MEKFKKMVAIEPTKLLPEWDENFKDRWRRRPSFMRIFRLDAATIIEQNRRRRLCDVEFYQLY